MYPNAPEGVTATSISEVPESLNGQEMLALLVFNVATELVKTLTNSPHNSPILSFRNYDFDWGFVATGNPTANTLVPSVKIEVSGKLQFTPDKRLTDILRILSGIGVWHRGSMGEGKVVDYQSRPSQKMLEHLGKLLSGDDLLKSFVPLFGGLNSVERVLEYNKAQTSTMDTTN